MLTYLKTRMQMHRDAIRASLLARLNTQLAAIPPLGYARKLTFLRRVTADTPFVGAFLENGEIACVDGTQLASHFIDGFATPDLWIGYTTDDIVASREAHLVHVDIRDLPRLASGYMHYATYMDPRDTVNYPIYKVTPQLMPLLERLHPHVELTCDDYMVGSRPLSRHDFDLHYHMLLHDTARV